jgi:hypothetical protein
MIELVALLFVDRCGDDLLDALPVIRMDDVPIPCRRRCWIGMVEAHDLEVLLGDRLRISRDRCDPAPGAREPLHLGQELLPTPQLLFDTLPPGDLVSQLLMGPLQLRVPLPELSFEIAHARLRIRAQS